MSDQYDELARRVAARRNAQPSETPEQMAERIAKQRGSRPAPKKERGLRPEEAMAQMAKGFTFDFSPKIAGGVMATRDILPKAIGGGGMDASQFGSQYEKRRDRVVELSEQANEADPSAAFALEMAGGMATGGGGALRTLAARNAIPKVGDLIRRAALARTPLARATTAGATEGAVRGIGASTGGVGDYAGNTTIGGTLGGVVGGIVGAVAGRGAGELARRKITRALTPDEEIAREASGLSRGQWDRVERGIGKQIDATDKSLDYFKNAGRIAQDTKDAAGNVIRKGREKGGMLVDELGSGGVRLLRAATNVGEKAQDFVPKTMYRRMKNQLGVIDDAIRANTGVGGRTVKETGDELKLRQKTNATPFYDRGLNHGPVTDQKVLAEYGRLRGLVPKAHEYALALAKSAPGGAIPPSQLFVKIGEKTYPTARYLDYFKRGVDGWEKKQGMNPEGDIGEFVGNVDKIRQNFMGEFNRVVPDLEKARAAWAGPAQVDEAMQYGKDLLKRPSRESAEKVKAMSESEREGYRVGAAETLSEFMEKVTDTGDIARKILSNPAIRAKIRTMFPDNASYVAYMRQAATQAKRARTASGVTGNSTTAQQLTDIENLFGMGKGELLGESIAAVATGGANLVGKAIALGVKAENKAIRRYAGEGNRKVADEVARRLLTRTDDAPKYNALLAGVERQNLGRTVGLRRGGQVGSSVGRVAGLSAPDADSGTEEVKAARARWDELAAAILAKAPKGQPAPNPADPKLLGPRP